MAEGKQIVVFLDYDGTLSPIVNDPEKAFMTDEVKNFMTDEAKIKFPFYPLNSQIAEILI